MAKEPANTGTLIVFCTCPNPDTASGLARKLVADKLAACCNLIPNLTSVYTWEGQVHEDPEVLLIAKTTAARYSELERSIVNNHPYELPEILAVCVESGLPGYLDWLRAETNSEDA